MAKERLRYNVEPKVRSGGAGAPPRSRYEYSDRDFEHAPASNKKKRWFIQIAICLVILTGIMLLKNADFELAKKVSATVDNVLTQQTDFNELSKNGFIENISAVFSNGVSQVKDKLTGGEDARDFVAPVSGTITAPFENRTHGTFGTEIEARGIELTTQSGTEVKSIADGVVRIIANSTLQEKRVVVEYEGGYLGIYDGIATDAKEGDEVKQGQAIGTTYASDGGQAVMSFELWKDSAAQNPEDYIKFEEK